MQVFSDNKLVMPGRIYRCALGRSGMIKESEKREGDGATPIGSYPIREIWYRADRVQLPKLNFPVHEIKREDGWCDAPMHPQYNQHIQLPFNHSHENLWRADHRYDLIVVLGYNDTPPVPYNGSCIFFHIAAPDYIHTEGCVAVNLHDMLEILPQLQPDAVMQINSERMGQ